MLKKEKFLKAGKNNLSRRWRNFSYRGALELSASEEA